MLYEQKKQQLADVQEKRKKVATETVTMKQRLAKLTDSVEVSDTDLEKLRKSSSSPLPPLLHVRWNSKPILSW